MLKQKVLANGANGQTVNESASLDASKSGEESIGKQLLLLIVWMLLGLIMPRASVYGGMAPFGVSFAAAIPGAGALGVYITSIVGYMLPGSAVSPLRYIAALVAVAGIKWALNGVKSASSHPKFAPLITIL